ncbi:MAG: patatin-like phospholipase family protein [Brevefilum sp.]
MKISLALGGGGVRGVAHIGVLRALENHGFRVKAIAGTSAGGLVGAVYAAGFSTEKIESTIQELDQNRSYERRPNDHPSLLGLSSVANKLSALLADCTFGDLKIPFAATAVSLHSGKEIILHQGKVIDAVMATIAVPGIFPSQEIGGRVLVDGGVLDPVPVRLARWMRPDLPVVAVMLHKTPENWDGEYIPFPMPIPGPAPIVERLTKLRPVQAFKIFARAIDVSSKQLTQLSIKLYAPEIIIAPRVGHIGLLQEINIQNMIQEGMTATEKTLSQIKAEANWVKRLQRKVKHRVMPESCPEIWENING